MSVKKIVIAAMLFSVVSVFISLPLCGQGRKINDFDITKVHKAVASDVLDSAGRNNSADTEGAYQKAGDSYFILMAKIIAYVLVLTIIIVAGIWIVKKLGFAGSSRLGGGSIDLLEALPIGQNRSITLIRVMDSVLVLGQTAQNISLLEKIEGEKAVELIASTKGGTDIVQFKEVFNNFIGKIKKTS